MFFSPLFKIKFNILVFSSFLFSRQVFVLISKPISFVVRGCSSLVRGCSSQKYPSQKCPSQIKSYGFSIFLAVIFLFAASCFFPAPDNDEPYLTPPAVEPVVRNEPKQPDPVKQGECKRRGRSDCEGDEDCEETCDDVFSRRRDKQECYEYSSEMVSELKDLIEATEDGDIDEIESIGPDVLECLLDIDETAFAKAIKKMSRREAQDFVVLIAGDEDFAEVLEEEDDEFNILKQLTGRLVGGGRLKEALSEEVEDDKTILWLFSEHNEGAWDWLDSYVDEECNGRDSEDCPGGENIGAYCGALLESGFRTSDWEDFLSDTGLFADEYEDEVEDEDYEYEITDSHGRDYEGDFRDYCELKARRSGGSNPAGGGGNPVAKAGSCPTGRPNARDILADIQLENSLYVHSDYRTNQDREVFDLGSSRPSQNIILYMEAGSNQNNEYLSSIMFDVGEISSGGTSIDGGRDYYIYVDGTRYRLTVSRGREGEHRYSSLTTGINYQLFFIENYPEDEGFFSSALEIAIASELNGGQCRFYTP